MTSTTPTALTSFFDAYRAIAQAVGPGDLFGASRGGSPSEQEASLRAATRDYHRLARLVHPDLAPAQRTAEAQEVFARLGALWEQYQRDHRDRRAQLGGTHRPRYPTSSARDGADRAGRTPHPTVRAGRRTYVVGAQFRHGELANLHRASYRNSDGRDVPVVLKMSRSTATNDAVERESTSLRHLAGRADAVRAAFTPHLVDSFRYRPQQLADPTGAGAQLARDERTAIVLEPVAGFHSLARIAQTHPDGLAELDLVWIWRRLLVALGHAQRAGVVHGAMVPDNILVRPRDQGLVLVEWGYSVVRRRRWHAGPATPPLTATGPVPVVERFAAFYPPVPNAEGGPSEAADVHMATRCMTTLFRDDTPVALLRFAQDCLLPAIARRPNVWQLVDEFDDIVGRLYGPRRDRPFHRSGIRFDQPLDG